VQGALVANYPWDGTEDQRTHYNACPDDETYRYLAGVYAGFHRQMHLSREFPMGITNGAAWYPVWGGMQVLSICACPSSMLA
jgi:carboxypeptidase D